MSETKEVRSFALEIGEMNKKGGGYNAESTEIKNLGIFNKTKILKLENIHSIFLENLHFKLYQLLCSFFSLLLKQTLNLISFMVLFTCMKFKYLECELKKPFNTAVLLKIAETL